jgi:inner membrane protein
MDSVTQFVLGASISGAILGPRIGAKSLLIGGLVATLPDLDSFIPFDDPIDNMTNHRGFSHSVFVQTLITPVIGFIIGKIIPSTWKEKKHLFLMVWLVLITHSLLDSLTTYGTQLFWPLNVGPPVAIPSIFIIDPVYTLLLFAGVLTMFFRRKTDGKGIRANRILLAISCGYLAIGLTGNTIISSRATASAQFENMRIHVQPTPFNLLIWQVTGVSDDKLATGMTNLFLDCGITHIIEADRRAIPWGMENAPPSVQRLEWFTDGFYSYSLRNGKQTISDLRIGFFPSYPFSFMFANGSTEKAELFPPERINVSYQERAGDIFRIMGETVKGCQE